jgi:hypothetical protein
VTLPAWNKFKILGFHGGGYEQCHLLDVMPCGSCKNQHFRGTYRLHHQGGKNQQARNNHLVVLCGLLQLLVTSDIVPSSLILSTLMMEAICSSKMLVITRAIWHHIPEDSILQLGIKARHCQKQKKMHHNRHECLFIVPESACSISMAAAKKVARY